MGPHAGRWAAGEPHGQGFRACGLAAVKGALAPAYGRL